MTTQDYLNDPNCPQEYKQGYALFCGNKFIVTPDVLIPRIETEHLVAEVVKFAAGNNSNTSGILTIADIGAGSGCVAISIAKELPLAKVIAIDLSTKALDIARKNAKFHKVTKQITFIENDLLCGIDLKADVLVANLPYIPSNNLNKLDNSVKDFEPHLALDGGPDGLALYRKLFEQIKALSSQPALILIELDDSHIELALKEAKNYFSNKTCEIIKDLFKYDRFLAIRDVR